MRPPPQTPPPGKYTCGVFLNGQYTFTQYLTLKDSGAYESSTGPTGRSHYDAASKRVIFETGKFEPLFGSYEPKDYPFFRLSSREDAQKSDYARAWRSQVCSLPKYNICDCYFLTGPGSGTTFAPAGTGIADAPTRSAGSNSKFQSTTGFPVRFRAVWLIMPDSKKHSPAL